MNFEDLPWHDAVLLNLSIDRRSRAEQDQVLLQVEWPDGCQNNLLFGDCYGLKALLNFGVIGDDTIWAAQVTSDDEDLKKKREAWAKLSEPLEGVRCYSIETNSTASSIKIFARTFEVLAATNAS